MYVNSAKERFYGDRWFKDYCAPVGFDCRMHKNELSPFFANCGFKVSMTYNAFYSAYNNIVSDRYLSPDLYFMYVVPALNRLEFRKALSDKSFYPILFNGERQPENVVVCASGHYYDGKRMPISREEAIHVCMNMGEGLVIKPSIDTGEGKNVDILNVLSKDHIKNEFKEREIGSGFIVQRIVKQHSLIAKMNETSLNTMRIFTYRRLDGLIVDIPKQHFLRFGGRGAYKDNVSRDGGFCHIHENGMLDSKVLTKALLGPMDFSARFDFRPFVIPSFNKALEFVKRLHSKLLYFDSIGWDVAITEDGEPCLIEFNVDANLRSAQMIGGPMYGEYIDEIMERVKDVQKIKIECEVNVFKHGYDRFTQIRGPEHDVL